MLEKKTKRKVNIFKMMALGKLCVIKLTFSLFLNFKLNFFYFMNDQSKLGMDKVSIVDNLEIILIMLRLSLIKNISILKRR